MSDALIHTLSLLYALQNERGIALLPAHHRHGENELSFEQQSEKTHETLSTTQKHSPDFWALLPERFFDAYALRSAPNFRTGQKPESLMEWYMFNLEHPIHQMALSQLTDNPRFTPSQTSALIHFIASLSYLSGLRDMGVNVYTKAEITSVDNSRLKNAASSYIARERLYLGLADETVKHMIDAARAAYPTQLAEVDQMVRKIKAGYAKGLLATTPLLDWLDSLNGEIAGLRHALFQTIRQLTAQGQELAMQTTHGQTLDSDVEHYLGAIGNLPLFRGLSESTLRNLLKGARLIDAQRNHTLVTQGEPTAKFFIVLDGWVKTIKTTAEGQESILQLLGKKECLLDSGFLGSSISTLSAKSISKTKLLSLSLPVLKDHVSRNRELAQNLLAATSNRLQRLVAQFEQMTLKTASQRVGWFLVNLHLETGIEGAPLTLPFDKALIASYLNIKPETFSRILKEFRSRGFVIEKDQIIMPTPNALCSFCDPEMAQRCCRAEAVNCAPIQLARKAEGK